MDNIQKITRKITVINELGMHARPASKIAQMAGTAIAPVWFTVDTQKVDATSIIDILALCAVKGTQICVEIENKEDVVVLDQIVDFFESGFGET